MKRTTKIISIMLSLVVILCVMTTLLVGCNDKRNTFVVGTQSGTTGEDYISNYSNCKCMGYDAAEDAVEAMTKGQLDFVVIDAVPAQKILLKDEYKDSIKIISYELTDEQYGFAFNKNNTALLNQVNQILDAMKEGENPILDQIISKYLNGEKVDGFKNNIVDTVNPNTQLVIATNSEFEPFEYVGEDEKFYGIDIEIAQYIANELGMQLSIWDMSFEDVKTAVNKKENVDIAMSAITITDERKETLAFSNSYYNASQVVVVKKDSTLFDNCKSADEVIKVISGK